MKRIKQWLNSWRASLLATLAYTWMAGYLSEHGKDSYTVSAAITAIIFCIMTIIRLALLTNK